MRRNRTIAFLFFLTFTLLAVAPATTGPVQTSDPQRQPDVAFVPTPAKVIDTMLKIAEVTSEDVVYDLGCGDGRIVIAAAKTYGARGVGIDIDPKRIEEAKANAQKEGVADRVSFRLDDLFETDISEANVVSLYLLPTLNMKLRPKLWEDLAVGTRIVSHAFNMGVWEPEQEIDVDGRMVYFWTITEETKRRLAEEQR